MYPILGLIVLEKSLDVCIAMPLGYRALRQDAHGHFTETLGAEAAQGGRLENMLSGCNKRDKQCDSLCDEVLCIRSCYILTVFKMFKMFKEGQIGRQVRCQKECWMDAK